MRSQASHAPAPASEPSAPVGQPTLPFPESALDAPISYGLTARARRLLVPSTLPDLTVLPGNVKERSSPDRFDTRPARARALRRSGRNLREIAAELEVDEELASDWTLGVVPVALRLRNRRSTSRVRHGREGVSADLEQRAAGVDDELAAASLLLGLAEVTPYAIALVTTNPAVARAVIRWLRSRIGVQAARLRITLATGPAVARDMAAHQWAELTGIPRQQVLATPWRDTPDRAAVRGTLRVADRHAAALVASWRAALQAGEPLRRNENDPDLLAVYPASDRGTFAPAS